MPVIGCGIRQATRRSGRTVSMDKAWLTLALPKTEVKAR